MTPDVDMYHWMDSVHRCDPDVDMYHWMDSVYDCRRSASLLVHTSSVPPSWRVWDVIFVGTFIVCTKRRKYERFQRPISVYERYAGELMITIENPCTALSALSRS